MILPCSPKECQYHDNATPAEGLVFCFVDAEFLRLETTHSKRNVRTAEMMCPSLTKGLVHSEVA